MDPKSLTDTESCTLPNDDDVVSFQDTKELKDVFSKVLTPWNYLVFYSRLHYGDESINESSCWSVKRLKELLVAFETMQFQLIQLLEATSNIAEIECNSNAVKFRNIAFEGIELQLNCNLMQILDTNESDPTNQMHIEITSSKEFQDEFDICQSAMNVAMHRIIDHVSTKINQSSKETKTLPSNDLRKSIRQQDKNYMHRLIPSLINSQIHEENTCLNLHSQDRTVSYKKTVETSIDKNELQNRMHVDINNNVNYQQKLNIKKLSLRKRQKIGLMVAKSGLAKAYEYVKENHGIDLPLKIILYFAKWYRKNYNVFCKSNRENFIRLSVEKTQRHELHLKDKTIDEKVRNSELENTINNYEKQSENELEKKALPSSPKNQYEPIASALKFVESTEDSTDQEINNNVDISNTSLLILPENINSCVTRQEQTIEDQLRALFGDDLELSFDYSD